MTASLVLFIIGFLAWQAWPALEQVGLSRLVSDSEWLPTSEPFPRYQILPMLVGSLLVALGAILWSAPVGILTALFSEMYTSGWMAVAIRRIIELLAGVPSVVFGFWGLVSVVPVIGYWQSPGQSLLAGIIVLGVMILPTVMLTSRSALSSIPESQILAAKSLGMTRLGIIRAVVIPYATRGIIAGCLLGFARAIGETMAVMMVCGNLVQFPQSVFDPMRTITANIALEMSYAGDLHRSVLFATGLILLLTIIGIMLLFQLWGRRGELIDG